MKASEVCKVLSDLMKEHGDLEVGMLDSEYGYYGLFSEIAVCQSNLPKRGLDADDDKLGKKFFGIGGPR